LIVALLLGWARPTGAEEVALSLDDAIVMARQRNASLRQSAIDLKLAELALLRRKLAYVDLKVSTSADAAYQYATPQTTEACPPNDSACWQPVSTAGLHGSLSIPVWSGFTMEGKLAAARWRHTSAAATHDNTLRRLVLEVGTAYWEVRRKELASAAMQTLARRFREIEQLTQQKVNAGLSPLVDQDRARAQTLDVELELTQATRELAAARAALASLLQIDDPIRLTEDLPDRVPAVPTVDQAVRTALAERPEPIAAEADLRAAAQDLRAAKGGYWPQISLVATADYAAGAAATGTLQNGATSSTGAPWSTTASYYGGVQMRWNVFDMMTTWMNVSQAGFVHERVQAQQERARQDVIADVRVAQAQLAAAVRARGASRKLVELARNDMQLLWRAYGTGAVKMIDVVEAQKELLRRELQLIDNAVGLAEADLNLQAAMGRL